MAELSAAPDAADPRADPICGLAHLKRSIAPPNGMDAKSSAGGPLSSPAAAQRCAEGAGLDSGAPDAGQSAMPSIALPCDVPIAGDFPPGCRNPWRASTQSRISTSLTDVTFFYGRIIPKRSFGGMSSGRSSAPLMKPGGTQTELLRAMPLLFLRRAIVSGFGTDRHHRLQNGQRYRTTDFEYAAARVN
jgi:hypothetical protein